MYDLLIIGAGPAGLTGALYASRAGLKVGVLEKHAPGGKLLNSHLFDNYPGSMGISGADLAMKFFEQAFSFGAEFINEEVIEVENANSDVKEVVVASGTKLKAKTIMITSGMKPKRLSISNYDKFFGKGISICIVCDGAFYRNKPIALIGGGYSATEEAMFAAKLSNEVYIINRDNELRGEKVTLDLIKKNPNIKIINNVDLLEVNGDKAVESISLKDRKTGELRDIKVNGVFSYIGFDPEVNFITKLNILNNNKYIEVDTNTMRTKIEGVYAAGDVIEKQFRQVTTAIADATVAALAINNYLNTKQ